MRLGDSARRGLRLAAASPRGLLAGALVVLLALIGIAAASAVLSPGPAISPAARRGAPAGGSDPLRPVLPAEGDTGDATCTDPSTGTEWRVSWRATSLVGSMPGDPPGLSPTGFWSRTAPGSTATAGPTPSVSGAPGSPDPATPSAPITPSYPSGPSDAGDTITDTPDATSGPAGPDGWVRRDLDTWELRWTPGYQASDIGNLQLESERRGTLDQLGAVLTPARHSPRFVSPDGGCTVELAPFGSGQPGWPTVAILGDSLVTQLGPERPATDAVGPLQATLLDRSERPQVIGQGGRRWTGLPGTAPGLDTANLSLLDEIRGLRGARAHVVALGVNDSGWASMAPDANQFELRMAWILFNLGPILDEIRDSGQCTVLVTASDRGVAYLGASRERYSNAAERINDMLRDYAGDDPDDDLHLWDWAENAAGHHTDDAVPWFGEDTIHLNEDGRAAYAEQLTEASRLC